MNRRQFLLAGAGSAVALAGCATRKSALDGATASIRTESPELQARKLAVLEAAKELGPTITNVELRRRKNIPGKRAAYYMDDVIFLFRDLAHDRPKSCWDHFLLSAYKEAYEKYGLKAQFNLFYRNDAYYGAKGAEFTLRDMPDKWRAFMNTKKHFQII